jgi:hypothetical protein
MIQLIFGIQEMKGTKFVLAVGDADKLIWLFYIVLADLRIVLWWLQNLFSNGFKI